LLQVYCTDAVFSLMVAWHCVPSFVAVRFIEFTYRCKKTWAFTIDQSFWRTLLHFLSDVSLWRGYY